MYFIAIDGETITGLYSDDGDFAAPPLGAVPVTAAEFALLKGGMGQYRYVNGAVVDNLDMHKAWQIKIIEAAHEAALDMPISYMGTTFQADEYSRNKITQVLSALGGAAPAGFAWTDLNNVGVPITNAQLQGMAGAIMARGYPLFQQMQARKASIRAAISKAEIEAVLW